MFYADGTDLGTTETCVKNCTTARSRQAAVYSAATAERDPQIWQRRAASLSRLALTPSIEGMLFRSRAWFVPA